MDLLDLRREVCSPAVTKSSQQNMLLSLLFCHREVVHSGYHGVSVCIFCVTAAAAGRRFYGGFSITCSVW